MQLLPNKGWDERVLVCRYEEVVDVFIVITERYVVIVDTVINAPTAVDVLHFAQPHLINQRQLLIINTHADYDHCWGNQIFGGDYPMHPAPILAHRLCADRFQEPRAAEFLAEMQAREPELYKKVRLTPPNLLFTDTFTIDGGDLTLQLFPTPGHAPDHVSIFIPEIRLLLAGDAAERPFPFARAAETLPQLRQSLRAMADLDPEYTLCCHDLSSSSTLIIQQNIAYFDALEARCRAALANGIPSELESIFPFLEAMPPGTNPDSLPTFYHSGHVGQIQMMLQWLQSL